MKQGRRGKVRRRPAKGDKVVRLSRSVKKQGEAPSVSDFPPVDTGSRGAGCDWQHFGQPGKASKKNSWVLFYSEERGGLFPLWTTDSPPCYLHRVLQRIILGLRWTKI